MKNWKKYAAIIGVIALLAIFCLPMYFALKGDFSQKAFMASLFTVLFVAVMCYVILMLFKYLSKLSRSAYSSTPLITAQRNVRNCKFSIGVLPGFNRF